MSRVSFCRLILQAVVLCHAPLIQGQDLSCQKIGHADWEFIFSRLPSYKRIELELKSFEGQLQNQLKLKSQEYEAKVKAYQELDPATPEAIRQDKASELAYLQSNFEKFQQEAEASLRKKQSELVSPVLEKIGTAIEEVAKENGYTYILNPQSMSGGDLLLFADERFDISELVLRKLGVETGN